MVLGFLETQSISYTKVKEITQVARVDMNEIFKLKILQHTKLSNLTKDWIYLQQQNSHDEKIKCIFYKLIDLLERDRQLNDYIIKSKIYEIESEIINRMLSIDEYINKIRLKSISYLT